MKEKPIDRWFITIVITLLLIGVFSFVSASLGILAKNEVKFYGVLFNQIALGLGGGMIALYATMRIPYKFWRTYSFYFFIGALILTALVFVPGIGFRHGGAQRWLALGPLSFQPVEVLKIAFVMYLAGWLSWVKGKAKEMQWSIMPLLIMLALCGFILFKQPDTKSMILMVIASLGILLMAGIPWKYIIGAGVIGVVAISALLIFQPYLRERVLTFINPSRDPQGASWQLQQSLIAIGSGGITGRGYGQSVQKFSYLPEPQGDSIFAVIGEEYGFIGTTLIIILYVMFALRGLRIAYHAPDIFSRLLVTGLVILLTAQSFMNIASITGLFPLTGVPLVFMSHGGTSLLISLAAIGIILQVSRYQKV